MGLSVAGCHLEGLELLEHPHWSPTGPEATHSWIASQLAMATYQDRDFSSKGGQELH